MDRPARPTPEEIRAHAPLQDHGEDTAALFVRATVDRENDQVSMTSRHR